VAAWERVGRLPLGAEIALALAAGAGTFALAAAAFAGIDSGVVAAFFGVVLLVAVIAIARFVSVAYAVPVGMAGMLAFDWFYLPPTHPLEFPDSANLVDLIIYLAVAVLLGVLAAHAARRAAAAERARGEIAEEQAALRRVATLVARGAPAGELFATVAAEAGDLLDVHGIRIARYEGETELVHVAEWSKPGHDPPPAYDRATLEGTSVSAEVLGTGRAVRVDNYPDLAVKASFARDVGLKSVVGAPVVVEGRVWGVMIAWSMSGPLPSDTERPKMHFAQLVATANSNTYARTGLARHADEQSAMRSVATLVARGAEPAETFGFVAAEIGRLFGAEVAVVFRYEPDRTGTVVGLWSVPGVKFPDSARLRVAGVGAAAMVLDTGQPVRTERFEGPEGSIANCFAQLGARSGVGAPITVEGRLWGVVVAATTRPEGLPVGSEGHIAGFTELMATAISNVQAREDLHRLADEQAALRRVATLVAEGGSPAAVFDAVAAEMKGLLGADQVVVGRFEPGAELTVLAHRGSGVGSVPAGARVSHVGDSVEAVVWRAEGSARVESYVGAGGVIAEYARAAGVRVAVGAPIVVDGRLWGVVSAGWNGQQSPPAGTERRMAQFAQLLDTATANADSRAELFASRARLVAASDAARRRFERDLHDGVQQRLVSLALELHRAEVVAPQRDSELVAQLARVRLGLAGALDDLRELSRGIHPAILSEGGLGPALRALARRSVVPVELRLAVGERLADHVEVGAYYVVSEALTNAVKHARASGVEVDARVGGGWLRLMIGDDGVGGADPARGSGLTGLADRVAALGGTIVITSPPGKGTSLRVELPLVSQ
jgi:signal transduction histidine kinase